MWRCGGGVVVQSVKCHAGVNGRWSCAGKKKREKKGGKKEERIMF